MAAQRAKKSRSLGIESVSPSHNPATATVDSNTTTVSSKRPELGDRPYSAPSVPQQKPANASRISQNSKASEHTKRNSKVNSHSDPSSRSTNNVSDPQNTDRQNRSGASSKRSSKQEDIPLLNFVVVGNEGVGKTAFIRNALDLHKHKTISSVSTSKVSLGGKIYRIQLIELLVEDVDCSLEGVITWPRNVNSLSFPIIDGTFCLFDVTQKGSTAGLQPIISALSTSNKPVALISCKVDVSDTDQEAAQTFCESAQKSFKHLILDQASIHSSHSAKRCLLQLLKSALNDQSMKRQTESRRASRSDSRDQKSQPHEPSSTSRRRDTTKRDQSRSKSRDSLLTRPNSAHSKPNGDQLGKPDRHEPASQLSLKVDTRSVEHSGAHRRNTGPQTPVSAVEASKTQFSTPAGRQCSIVPETPESCPNYTMLRPGTAGTDDSRTQHTFLNMDDDSIHSNMSESDSGATGSLEQLSLQESKSDKGIPFTDLVSRLLSLPTTRSDEKFIPSFLCLYRCFATPHQLLNEIADRFVKVENDNSLVTFAKVAEQLRYLSVLSLWTEDYPGDFAATIVRDVMLTFIKSIEKSKHFGPAAKEINNNLLVYFADEDEDWAYGGTLSNRSRSTTSAQKGSSNEALNKIPSRSAQVYDSENEDSEDDAAGTYSSVRDSGAPSSTSSLLKSGVPPTKSATNQAALETARKNARRLHCIPHLRVSKVQWHLFMDCPIEDMAREITRISWVLYSAIRPRDFVRQATLTGTQKARQPSFDAVAAMTRQFNHLTFFVSGMILLRDKPKHRARILERFMHLAWKVRQQNDYQSLGAIVAALKGEEIIRLGQTHELIPHETLKQFWRLKILMDHQRSHSAYRMAWENSFNERIPFLPRVQEDLTKAAAGNATFIGQNIKWSKFEVMAETIVSLQKSRETPYQFPERTQRSQELARLVLETKVLGGSEDSDDPRYELYERSKQIEPQTATDGKKKFDWLRR